MPKQSIKVDINTTVFKWLRESSGWTVEDVSKRLNTSSKTVELFETGQKKPTFRQLTELSHAYKRPIATFLLSAPKEEKPKPKDYRMLPDKVDVFDKKTIYVLRMARNLQEIGKELSYNIDYNTETIIKKATLAHNPEQIAVMYRIVFDIAENRQTGFKTPYDFFNYLRDILEDMNILVFQFSMPVKDARGFALVDETPAVIVVNTKDSIEARLFSLMHEFAHILLGESVIDLPDLSSSIRNRTETWCNNFSSMFFLPKIIAIPLYESNKTTLTNTETLNTLSRKYKVSKLMLLYNMLKLGFITKTEYNDIINRYVPKEILPSEKKEKKQGGGIPSDIQCLSKVGNKFISIVANNYDKKYITYTDALNYLSIKSKNFDKVLEKARK